MTFRKQAVFLLAAVGTIFLAEFLAMLLIAYLPSSSSTFVNALFDALLVVSILLPFLYVIVLNPIFLEQRLAGRILQKSEERFRSLVDATDDSIYLVDRHYRYLFMNRRHLGRLGLTPDSYYSRPYGEFHSKEETAEFVNSVDRVFAEGRSFQEEHRSQRDGRYFLRTLSPVRDQDGRTIAAMVVSKQITERKRMEEELRVLSITDELTGLYNRRGFFTLAEQQLRLVHRLGKKMLLLAADLDDLKVVNDRWGHQEGDQLLIETASLLRETFRASDIVARIGGDEFVVLQIEDQDSSAEIITDRLFRNAAAYNRGREREYELSISVGIAYYDPEAPCTMEELLEQADRLMYEQKKQKS